MNPHIAPSPPSLPLTHPLPPPVFQVDKLPNLPVGQCAAGPSSSQLVESEQQEEQQTQESDEAKEAEAGEGQTEEEEKGGEEGEEVEEVHQVEAIVDSRQKGKRKRVEYLIKWEGYDASFNTWEPPANINKELIHGFEAALQTGGASAGATAPAASSVLPASARH